MNPNLYKELTFQQSFQIILHSVITLSYCQCLSTVNKILVTFLLCKKNIQYIQLNECILLYLHHATFSHRSYLFIISPILGLGYYVISASMQEPRLLFLKTARGWVPMKLSLPPASSVMAMLVLDSA